MTTEYFDPMVVDDVDQGTVEKTEVQFPIVQWHRGDPKMRKAGGMDYQGGWFVPEAMAPTDLTAYGFERTTWMHNDQDETEGFYARELAIAVIRERRRWEVYDGARRLNFAWKDFEKAQVAGRPSGRAHILALIKGLEQYGPFVLTLRGMAGVYFSGSRHVKGVLPQFDAVVVKAANDAVRKAGKSGVMPRRAFWLSVGAARDEKTLAPLFVDVGQGADKSQMVIPVALGLPEKAEQVDLSQFFVGRTLLAQASALYNDVATWAAAWDSIAPGSTEGEQAEAGTESNGKPATAVTEDIAKELGL